MAIIARGISVFGILNIDQAGGVGDSYGVLSGDIDGSNTTFTVSKNKYATGKLQVYLNGQLLTQGSGQDWRETDPSSGTFDFIEAPYVGEKILATYVL